MDIFKRIARNILPPILIGLFKKPAKYGFFGNYFDWQMAINNSSGYDSPIIFQKVVHSATKVKQGMAMFERDGITFNEKQYSWPVVAILLLSASQNNNHLNILDFGGSLGSSYFQNIEYISHLKDLHWAIVEQNNLYQYGKQHFENNTLSFHRSIDEALKIIKPQVFLASSVIQYIEKPYELLKQIVKSNFQTVIFDRTPFFIDKEILTVQKVSPRIYDASYPAWILDIAKLKEFFLTNKYQIIAESEQGNMPYNGIDGFVSLKHITFQKIQ